MPTDDYPINGTATNGRVVVGSYVLGSIEVLNDQDWFRVTLSANTTYGFYQVQTPTDRTDGLDSHLYLLNPTGNSVLREDDDSLGNRNSYFTYTPSQSGDYYLVAEANDYTFFGTLTGTYSVSVAVLNRAPSVTTFGSTIGLNAVVPAASLVSATDPDGNAIQQYQFYEPLGAGYLSWTGYANWDSSSRILSVDASQLSTVSYFGAATGTENLLARASDGSLWSSWTNLAMTVGSSTNHAPVVSQAIPSQTWTEGVAHSFAVPAGTFSDADGNALIISASLANGNFLPSWLAYDFNTRQFSGTPPAGTEDLSIKVTAMDPGGLSATTQFTILTPAYSQVPSVRAADIFQSIGAQGSGGDASGVHSAGVIRVMADFARAAYQVQAGEPALFNDPAPTASAAKAEVLDEGWLPLIVRLPSIAPTSVVDGSSVANIQSGGFYTIGNAAAFIARSADAIVISFRGTNDSATPGSPTANPSDPGDDHHPDNDQWGAPFSNSLSMADHYALFNSLIHAFDAYVASDPQIKTVYVTGHSLGGAMAIEYMSQHANAYDGSLSYVATTFAAPAFTLPQIGLDLHPLQSFSPDPRITQIEIADDPVPATWALSTRPGKEILFTGDHTQDIPDGFLHLNTDNHSMDFYSQVADSVAPSAWQEILNQPGSVNVLLGASSGPYLTATPSRPSHQFDTYFIVDGRVSGLWPDGTVATVAIDQVVNAAQPDVLSAAQGHFSTSDSNVIYGGGGNDRLTGGTGAELLIGGSGNDTLQGGIGNDSMDGGTGIDEAIFTAASGEFSLARTGVVWTVTQHVLLGADPVDRLTGIERLVFSNTGVALDLNGSAGTVAEIIGAVLGAGEVHDAALVGVGLGYLDNGMSAASLMQAALNYALGDGASNTKVIDLLFANLMGRPATQADESYYLTLMSNGGLSQAALGMMAAESDINLQNIGFAGLSDSGLQFTPS